MRRRKFAGRAKIQVVVQRLVVGVSDVKIEKRDFNAHKKKVEQKYKLLQQSRVRLHKD